MKSEGDMGRGVRGLKGGLRRGVRERLRDMWGKAEIADCNYVIINIFLSAFLTSG